MCVCVRVSGVCVCVRSQMWKQAKANLDATEHMNTHTHNTQRAGIDTFFNMYNILLKYEIDSSTLLNSL